MSEAQVQRLRHACLWLDGHRLKRRRSSPKTGHRDAFDKAAAKYRR